VRLAVAGEELGGGGDGWATIGVEAAMAAVVKDDVAGVAATLVDVDFPYQVLRDFVGGGLLPIRRHGVPGDGDETELTREFEHVGAARTKGRAEVNDRFADDIGEDVAGARDFIEHFGRCGAREVRVGPGMIADEMADAGHAAGELDLGLGELADHEKCGVDVVLGEDVEEARRPCRIGAVVEGEGELARAARGDEGAAEDLRGGPVGGVGETGHAEANSSGDAEARANLHDYRDVHIVFSVRLRQPMRK